MNAVNTAADYPLCDTCTTLIKGIETNPYADDALMERHTETFLARLGPLNLVGTAPVPDVIEWDCSICHEPQTGDATWARLTDTATISRSEYARKRAHGYAGPACELITETWPATHWMLVLRAAGTCLVPVTVAD